MYDQSKCFFLSFENYKTMGLIYQALQYKLNTLVSKEDRF